MTNECEHGRLARKCEICELQATEEKLDALVDVLDELFGPFGATKINHVDYHVDIDWMRKARTALAKARDEK